MLCQKCQNNQATTHIRRSINGKTTEMHLCSECAKEQGISTAFGGWTFPSLHSEFTDFFGNLFKDPMLPSGEDAETCPGCGLTFDQIARYGKVGCAQCYTTFKDSLIPSIERIHGQTSHRGKQPILKTDLSQIVQTPSPDDEISKLQEELKECLQREEYERCAELRDKIRVLEEKKEG